MGSSQQAFSEVMDDGGAYLLDLVKGNSSLINSRCHLK